MPGPLHTISDFSPTGALGQTLRDTWAGAAPQPFFLAVMAGWLIVAGLLSVRLFTWE